MFLHMLTSEDFLSGLPRTKQCSLRAKYRVQASQAQTQQGKMLLYYHGEPLGENAKQESRRKVTGRYRIVPLACHYCDYV